MAVGEATVFRHCFSARDGAQADNRGFFVVFALRNISSIERPAGANPRRRGNGLSGRASGQKNRGMGRMAGSFEEGVETHEAATQPCQKGHTYQCRYWFAVVFVQSHNQWRTCLSRAGGRGDKGLRRFRPRRRPCTRS